MTSEMLVNLRPCLQPGDVLLMRNDSRLTVENTKEHVYTTEVVATNTIRRLGWYPHDAAVDAAIPSLGHLSFVGAGWNISAGEAKISGLGCSVGGFGDLHDFGVPFHDGALVECSRNVTFLSSGHEGTSLSGVLRPSRTNRVLKNDFSSEKTCKKANEIEGRFSETCLFQ